MKKIILALSIIGIIGVLYVSLTNISCIKSITQVLDDDAKNNGKFGIDVSHHQKWINWEEVATESVEFVYIKATEGATYVDPRFHENAKGAKDAGLLIGAYHYFRMTSNVADQFDNFKSAMDKHKMDLVPMIDVETDDNKPRIEVQKALEKFIEMIKDEYGVSPMIYGTQRSYNTYCAPEFNNYNLYIGRYGSNSPEIRGEGTYTIWQYTETGRIKGVSKNVDKCRFHPNYSIKDIMILYSKI